MSRGTWIVSMGVLIGALSVVSPASGAGQETPSGLPASSDTLRQQVAPSVNLSDEERADLFMARKSYDEAVNYYSRAIKFHPVSAENREQVAGLWNKMGICYQQQMDYGKARGAYKHAIRVKKDFSQAWNNLGTTFYLNRQPKKSIKFYRRAIKLNPMAASFHMNLGTAYFEQKKYKRATAEYRTALQLDPDALTRNSREGTDVETRYANSKFFFYMAKIFASVGNQEQAIRYLQRAMEEGFSDRKRILEDPDLKKISQNPAFIGLMKNPPVPIKN